MAFAGIPFAVLLRGRLVARALLGQGLGPVAQRVDRAHLIFGCVAGIACAQVALGFAHGFLGAPQRFGAVFAFRVAQTPAKIA